MNCIIVDDEPLAREAMKLLIEESDNLQLIGSFNSAATASDFMEQQGVDLVFLDIQMPGITGIEFARTKSIPDMCEKIFFEGVIPSHCARYPFEE
jgi:two-component SAPR family response regulator